MHMFLAKYFEQNPIRPISDVQEPFFIAEVDKLNKD